jgi:hypothetical protein
LSGDVPFGGIDASVADFWRFAMSDLRTINVGGYLAEFLVARALGSQAARVEWGPWDVTAPDPTVERLRGGPTSAASAEPGT